MRNRKNWNK